MEFGIYKIIDESINEYIADNVLNEGGDLLMEKKRKRKKKKKKHDSKQKSKHKKKGLRRNAIKLKGGRRKDYDAEYDTHTNPNLTKQDNNDISALLNNNYINLAAVARDVYPNHTDEGAQSQLRKKVKGLKSDSGSTYKIKKKEADKIYNSIYRHIKRV